jgi:hypothetical protein
MPRLSPSLWLVLTLTACEGRPVVGHNLPVPPPAELTPKGAGIYEAYGDVEKPGSTVWIVNASNDLSFGQETTTGIYQLLIRAECGDDLSLSWRTDTESSGERHQVVVEGCDAADAGR